MKRNRCPFQLLHEVYQSLLKQHRCTTGDSLLGNTHLRAVVFAEEDQLFTHSQW